MSSRTCARFEDEIGLWGSAPIYGYNRIASGTPISAVNVGAYTS
ncbi:hypothetical protein [Paraburkholderia sprentiae]|nr:hypothetical protein [Paraburkholderia sprentiae]